MDKSIWEETVREDAHEEAMRSCNRSKRGVYAEEGEGLSFIKGRKGRS